MGCPGWKDKFGTEPENCFHVTVPQAITAWMPVGSAFRDSSIRPDKEEDQLSGTLLQLGKFTGSSIGIDKAILTHQDDQGTKTEIVPKTVRWINVYPSSRQASPVGSDALCALTPGDRWFRVRVEEMLDEHIGKTWRTAEIRAAARLSMRARRVHCGLTTPDLIVTLWHDHLGYALRTTGLENTPGHDTYDFFFPQGTTVELFEKDEENEPKPAGSYKGLKLEILSKSVPFHGLHQDPPWPTEP